MIQAQKYEGLIDDIARIIDGSEPSRDEKLQQICKRLADDIDAFDWVGFYLVDPATERELILGPFVGEPTDHTRIPFGKGICGQSAETNQTFVVQDVNQADNYLSCSVDVQAEIVVPVKKDGDFIAQLDIDSHKKNSITDDHRKILEKICEMVAKLF